MRCDAHHISPILPLLVYKDPQSDPLLLPQPGIAQSQLYIPITSIHFACCVMDVKAVTGDQLVEKLDSLAMKNSRPGSEGSYDYVDEQGDSMSTPVENTLSVQTTEQWERQLMKDPKVPPRTDPELRQVAEAKPECRIDLPSLHSPNTAAMPSSNARPRSRTPRTTMSRSPLREAPSPIRDHLVDAGSLLPPTSFELPL